MSNDLLNISSMLASSMRLLREKWFDACIKSINLFDFSKFKLINSSDSAKNMIKDIANMKLFEAPDKIIKSFQVVHILSFANMQNYAKSNIGEFTRLLCTIVYGEELDSCKPLIQRYTELKEKHHGENFYEQFLKFSEDLSLIIAGISINMVLDCEKFAQAETGRIGVAWFLQQAVDMVVLDFYYRNLFIVAEVFGDEETARQLLITINKET